MKDLRESGMQINLGKSQLSPVQELHHLGFLLDLKNGCLQVPVQKLKAIQKELGKLVTRQNMTCRKMAAILGGVRSFLTAMPFLRAFTDHMLAFIQRSKVVGWDKSIKLPSEIVEEVKGLKTWFSKWKGRSFQGKVPVRTLHSDSSDWAWGGKDVKSGAQVMEYWRDKRGLHINVKELWAALNTLKSLSKKGETIHLCVDNSVAFSYLSKGGGKVPMLNQLTRDFWVWATENNITVVTSLLKSKEDQADSLSRTPKDKGDYALHPWCREMFLSNAKKFLSTDLVDMFASPGNKVCAKFVSRYPHWEACMVDALKCPLEGISDCYANPLGL